MRLTLGIFFSLPGTDESCHKELKFAKYEHLEAWLEESLRGYFTNARVAWKGQTLLFMRRDGEKFRTTFTIDDFSQEARSTIWEWQDGEGEPYYE